MKYILTGYTGFIGSSILDRIQKNNDVLCIGREWKSDKNLPNKIKEFEPDYIIHCAAEIKNSLNTFSSNIEMTNWLLESTINIPYKSMVVLGSSSEYGKTNLPIKETELLKPRTMYEGTKAAATLLCLGFANEYNKPIAIVRPFSVYGLYEPEVRLIPTIFRNIKNNIKSKISVGVHDFIYIEDFLDGLFYVLYSEHEIIKGDVVHFGSGIQYSNLEVYSIIKDLVNSDLECEKIENVFNKYDSMSWVADITYAKSKYKFEPKYNLKQGLKDFYEKRFKQTV
jgi:nucleoside-diphosphate-sugar epimerase